MRVIPFFLILMISLTSCRTASTPGDAGQNEVAPDTETVATPIPTPTPRPTAAPPPVPEEAFEPELLPEHLEGKLAVRDYTFRRDDNGASLSLTLENLQPEQPMTMEAVALFEDPGGDVVAQTEPVRITINPLRRHPYRAQTHDPRAVSGKIMMRLIEKH